MSIKNEYILVNGNMYFIDKIDCIESDENNVVRVLLSSGTIAKCYQADSRESAVNFISSIEKQMNNYY